MAKMTYVEQLRHPNWQRKRLQCLEAADWKCQDCGSGEVTLNVHHKRYVKGRMAWEYELNELEVLCEQCHEEKHALLALLHRILDAGEPAGRERLKDAIGLICGYLVGSYAVDIELEDEIRGICPTVDLGIVAYIVGSCDATRVADALDAIYPEGQVKGPVAENLIDRWRLQGGRARG